MKNRKYLGDLLIEAGLITREQLNKALVTQKTTRERLGRILVNLGYITEEDITRVLEVHLGVPYLDMSAMTISRDVAMTVPASLAERHHVIPVKKEGKKITLAMADPTNFFAIDDVRMVTGCEIVPVFAAERDILHFINQIYGVKLVEKAVNKLRPEDSQASPGVSTTDEAPVVSIVNSLIAQAVKERASDIHIEPQEQYVRVRLRVDGMLREGVTIPKASYPSILSRIKIISELDISEKRLPQDGRVKVIDQGREIDLRVSTMPTIMGEKVVIRILDKQAGVFDVAKIGFSRENFLTYSRLYNQSYGMILVTGPTGSGKTTTLYSTLTELNHPSRNVITVEDPVEYRLPGINQIQVNPKAEMTFSRSLRSILRQDPNIIMVGEIRDFETAETAVRAALTGHLVFSTLHTNDAPGAINRLIDMQVEPFLVAASVLGVVSQRLVRLICPECKHSYEPERESLERTFLNADPALDLKLYRGSGCNYCNHTGYMGRMSIHEVMVVSSPIRELINRKASHDELAAAARAEGMITIRQDGIAKALQGLTTVEEVMRVAYTGE